MPAVDVAVKPDGTPSPLPLDANGNLAAAEAMPPGAEDDTNDVIGVTLKPLAVSTYTWSKAFTTALAASLLVKGGPGVLRSVFGRIDQSAGSADLYIQVLDAASLPGDGAVTHLIAPIHRKHVNGTDDSFSIDLTDAGVYATTGVVIVLSSTETTKTIAGAFLSATALYK